MRRCTLVALFILVACQAMAVIVVDEPLDTNPAPWRTNPAGSEPTTYQSWAFPTNAIPVDAEVDLNPYGTAVLFGNPSDMSYYESYEGRQGVWSFEDEIDILIPNNPVKNPYKEMWVQMTFTSDEGNAPLIYVLPEEQVADYVVMSLVGVDDLLDGFYHATYHVIIEPNPSVELTIVRPFDCMLFLDDIIVETICVPEPATLILLGLGSGLTLLRKRGV